MDGAYFPVRTRTSGWDGRRTPTSKVSGPVGTTSTIPKDPLISYSTRSNPGLVSHFPQWTGSVVVLVVGLFSSMWFVAPFPPWTEPSTPVSLSLSLSVLTVSTPCTFRSPSLSLSSLLVGVGPLTLVYVFPVSSLRLPPWLRPGLLLMRLWLRGPPNSSYPNPF